MSTNDPRSIAPPDSPRIGATGSQSDYLQDASRHQFWSSSPSTESLALQQERIRHRNEIVALAAQRDSSSLRAEELAEQVAELQERNAVLVAALTYAVEQYGKRGGPWNVPSDPGGWLTRARAVLAQNAAAEKEGT